MMPVATPPNTIAYASGYIKISDMIRAGFLVNLLSLIVILIILTLVLGPIFDVEIDKVPTWIK